MSYQHLSDQHGPGQIYSEFKKEGEYSVETVLYHL